MARNKKKKLSFWSVVLVGLFMLLVGFWGWYKLASRPVSNDKTAQTFVVRKGANVDTIGKNLEEKGIIRSSSIFKLVVMQMGIATDIQAGSFRLLPSMSVPEIARSLTEGRQDIWVTLLEGWRREEIAEGLAAAFTEVGGEFDSERFLELTRGKEGRLFPDTYLFPIDASEEIVVSVLENTFEKKLTDEIRQGINVSGKSLNQILTMASLIEREARDEASRPLVSGILWKRLDNDWPLQVDATLQYAKGYDPIEQTWWKPPLAADKIVESSYNTYANQGLPPGPICSPSLSSIQAAIYPKASSYWFYLTDNKGSMHYAETVEEHNANVNKYIR